MKKFFVFALLVMVFQLRSQKDQGEIVYYEDSDVKHSRMSLALLANPNFSNRNLVNDDIPEGGGFDLLDANTTGDFALNYNLDLFYSVSPSLDVGIGFGRANAFYSINDVRVYNTDSFPIGVEDTVQFSADISTNMWTVPLKLNFNTSISDLFDLEVIPTVSLIFPDKYRINLYNNSQTVDFDISDYLRNLNWRVGISLGGTWYFADSWGFFLRANANYLLNAMVEREGYPRETIYSFGADIGVKVHLF